MRIVRLQVQEGQPDEGLQVLMLDVQGSEEEVIPKSRTFMADGEPHRVFRRGNGDVLVDHVNEDGGKWDVINLTKTSGARTVGQGVKAVKDYHDGKGPSYYGRKKR